MDTRKLALRVVVFKEGEAWVAQCLEHDIATQAPTIEELAYQFERAVAGHVVIATEQGMDPFAHLPKAPEKFFQMFERAAVALTVRQNITLEISPTADLPRPELRLVEQVA